jgi:hypothetical protein
VWLKRKYREGKQYKSVGAKSSGDSTRRRHSNWFGKNPVKGAGSGEQGKKSK